MSIAPAPGSHPAPGSLARSVPGPRRRLSGWELRRLRWLRKVELSKDERLIVMLRFHEKLEPEEIAAELNVTVARARELYQSLIARAETIERAQQRQERIRAQERRAAKRRATCANRKGGGAHA